MMCVRVCVLEVKSRHDCFVELRKFLHFLWGNHKPGYTLGTTASLQTGCHQLFCIIGYGTDTRNIPVP
eukprot:scaffold445869_cov22-Prasinocladus_malaysianus.AAC.1